MCDNETLPVVLTDEEMANRARTANSMRGTEQVGRWTIQYRELADADHCDGAGQWVANVWYGVYEGERSFRGHTRDAVEAAAREWVAPVRVSLMPLDVGFDVRATGHAVELPVSGEITLTVPGKGGFPVVLGPLTRGWAATKLRERGYKVA